MYVYKYNISSSYLIIFHIFQKDAQLPQITRVGSGYAVIQGN